jgi:hypothetical protein
MQEKKKKSRKLLSSPDDPRLLIRWKRKLEGRMGVEESSAERQREVKHARTNGRKKKNITRKLDRSNIFVEHATGRIGRQVQVRRRCS